MPSRSLPDMCEVAKPEPGILQSGCCNGFSFSGYLPAYRYKDIPVPAKDAIYFPDTGICGSGPLVMIIVTAVIVAEFFV